jgi:hypothetical protein
MDWTEEEVLQDDIFSYQPSLKFGSIKNKLIKSLRRRRLNSLKGQIARALINNKA